MPIQKMILKLENNKSKKLKLNGWKELKRKNGVKNNKNKWLRSLKLKLKLKLLNKFSVNFKDLKIKPNTQK